MNNRIAKQLRRRAIAKAELEGRTLLKAQWNIHGEVVEPDEFRQIKKQYKKLKQSHDYNTVNC